MKTQYMKIFFKIKTDNLQGFSLIFLLFSSFLYYLSTLYLFSFSIRTALPQRMFLPITCLSVHTVTFPVNCKTEYREACGADKKDAALPLPMEHTVRHACYAICQREVTMQPLLDEHCGCNLPWVCSKIPTDVNYNMI